MNKSLYMLAFVLLFAGCVKNDWRDFSRYPPRPLPVEEEISIDALPAAARSAIQRQDPSGRITKVIVCKLEDPDYGKKVMRRSVVGYKVVLEVSEGTSMYTVDPQGQCEQIDSQQFSAPYFPTRAPSAPEMGLKELLRRSESIVVGNLKTSDDSVANKMWAGHITVQKVLLGDPTMTDIHVHFYHSDVATGAALREDGQAGVWFIFRDGNLLTIARPYQLKPTSYEATLLPSLKEFLKSEIQRLSNPDAKPSEARLGHLKLNYSSIKKRIAD